MENKLIDDCMKLGFGMMRLPRVEGTNDIDLEHTKRMVDAFMEAGGKYFDTAYIYEGSEEATKALLCDRYPRESYYLADKLNGSDRIATFDMDGTFVGELYPSYFEYNLLEYRALDDPDYEAPKDVMKTAQEIRDFVQGLPAF